MMELTENKKEKGIWKLPKKVWYVEKMYYFCMVNTDKNGKM